MAKFEAVNVDGLVELRSAERTPLAGQRIVRDVRAARARVALPVVAPALRTADGLHELRRGPVDGSVGEAAWKRIEDDKGAFATTLADNNVETPWFFERIPSHIAMAKDLYTRRASLLDAIS